MWIRRVALVRQARRCFYGSAVPGYRRYPAKEKKARRSSESDLVKFEGNYLLNADPQCFSSATRTPRISCSSVPSSSQTPQSAAHPGAEQSYASKDRQTEQSKSHSYQILNGLWVASRSSRETLGLDLPYTRPTESFPDRRVLHRSVCPCDRRAAWWTSTKTMKRRP